MGRSLKLLFISGALTHTKHETPWVRKFGYLCIREILVLRKSYVHPPLCVSWGELLHFKHPHSSAVSHLFTWAFREKKQQQSQVFNVYTEVDNRGRARAVRQKTKETNFVGRKTWKLYSGGEKMRNVTGHLGENEWQ